MAERRQVLIGFGIAGAVGVAGWTLLGQEDDADDHSETLPPDSSGLFFDGELQEHNFAESSFTEDDVGTAVSEFDLANADTSNVETMGSMFTRAESFDQDIDGWCVEQIPFKPIPFDDGAGFEGDDGKQPNWGAPC